MKKALLILLAILLLFVSCSLKDDYCVNCYFMDSCYVLDYCLKKNTLFVVKVPLNLVVDFGKEQGLSTVPKALEEFSGLKADCSVNGTPSVKESLLTILGCWTDSQSPEDLAKAMVAHAQDLSKQPLSSKINRLCSADVSTFIECISRENTEVVYMDSTPFLNSEDAMFARKYFGMWLKQLIGD